MGADLNTVQLVGRITRDAELTYTSSGTPKAAFAIAVNRSVKKGDKWEDVASFFDLVIWDKRATGLQKYLVKGQQVAVWGSLEQQRWEKDGQKHSKVAVVVENIQLVGSKPGGSGSPAGASSSGGGAPQGGDDDIPF